MMLKQAIDLFILALVSAAAIYFFPVLGITVLLLNVLFATQYWKSLLLIGSDPAPAPAGQRAKAAILASLFTVILGMAIHEEPAASQVETVMNLWNHDFFPVVIAVAFLSSLLMVALITEKRKR